jgi:hypothetical protein
MPDAAPEPDDVPEAEVRAVPVADDEAIAVQATAAGNGAALKAGNGSGPDDHAASSDGDVVDVLPDDLDAAGYVGPYMFPDNNRRRVPGYLYLGIAAGCAALWATVDSVYVNGGFLGAAVLLAAVGVYQIVSGWNLDVDEQDALVAASKLLDFPVGHASAQMGWRGLLSRPTWRILLYSSENPPQKRGLVLVDGVDGTIVEHFVEDNPEDWASFAPDEPASPPPPPRASSPNPDPDDPT